MKGNSSFLVKKAIPLNDDGSKKIPEGTTISVTNGLVYQDGIPLSVEWQKEYLKLIEYESVNGWNYLKLNDKKTVNNLADEKYL